MSVLIKALEKAQAEKAQAKKNKQSLKSETAQKRTKSAKKSIGAANKKTGEISLETLSLAPSEPLPQAIPLQEPQALTQLNSEDAEKLAEIPPQILPTPAIAEPSPVERVAIQRPDPKIGVERRAPQPKQTEAANVFASKRIEATNQDAKLLIVAGAALIGLLAIGVYFYRVLHNLSEPSPPHVVQAAKPTPATSAPVVSPMPEPATPVGPVGVSPVAAETKQVAQSEPPAKKIEGKSTAKPAKRLIAEQEQPSDAPSSFESDSIETVAPLNAKKGAASKTLNVDKGIASESASIQVSRSKPQAAVNPVLMRAYEAYNAGNEEEAQKLYKQVLLSDRLNVDAMLGLGAIAVHQGRSADANAWYRKVLELDPRNAVAQAALLDSQQQENPQASATQIKTMIAKSPTDPSLYVSLGNAYAAQNQWADAQQSYFEAYRLHQSAENAYNLAVSLDQMGKPKLALPYYQETLRLLPSGASNIDRAAVEARIAAIQ